MSCLLAPDPEIGAGADVESWEPHSGGSRSCGWLPPGLVGSPACPPRAGPALPQPLGDVCG